MSQLDVRWNNSEADPEVSALGESLSAFLGGICDGSSLWPEAQSEPPNKEGTGTASAGHPPATLQFVRSGGSGHVFALTRGLDEASYCVKVLRRNRGAIPAARKALLDEAGFLRDIELEEEGIAKELERPKAHVSPIAPHIVLLNDQPHSELPIEKDTALPFFVLERGITLADLLKTPSDVTPASTNEKWSRLRREQFWKRYGPSGDHAMAEALREMLSQLDLALEGIHRTRGFHLDIKPENILALFRGSIVRYCLFDFGSFKKRDAFTAAGHDAYFESTHDTLPDAVKKLVRVREATSDKRVRVPIQPLARLNIGGADIDRHQLGRVILDFFDPIHPYDDVRRAVRRDSREFLLELSRCLLHSEDKTDPAAIRTSGARTIDDVAEAIDTARDAVTAVTGSGLVLLPGSSVQGFDERVETIVRQRLLTRLRRVRQLGLSYLVYPGATHSRYEHLLGTFQAAHDYLYHLLSPSGSRWLAARITARQIHLCLLQALCHDVGHYPFAHYVEDTGLFPDHKDLTEWILTADKDALGLTCPGSGTGPCGRKHDAGACPWRLVEPDELESLHRAFRSAFAVTPDDWKTWFSNLESSSDRPRTIQSGVFKVLSEIVDGPLDSDKCDYVRRDAAHCGFASIGGVETDLLLKSLTVCADPSANAVVERYVLGVRHQAHCVLEQLALARYHLYSLVYWNAQCRMVTCLLRDAVISWAGAAIRSGRTTDLWDTVAWWCRAAGDDDALAKVASQDEQFKARIAQLSPPMRPALMVAQIGEAQRAAFDGLVSVAQGAVQALRPPKPSWAKPKLALGGTGLSDMLAAGRNRGNLTGLPALFR